MTLRPTAQHPAMQAQQTTVKTLSLSDECSSNNTTVAYVFSISTDLYLFCAK